MGSLKSPHRSSIDIIAINCLLFEKIAFFCILATDRRTNRWTALKREAACFRKLRLNNCPGGTGQRHEKINSGTGSQEIESQDRPIGTVSRIDLDFGGRIFTNNSRKQISN